MLMAYIWLAMAASAVIFGAASGRAEALSSAFLEGAGAAVELCIGIAGPICLWSGLMETMSRSGLSDGLAHLLRPFLSFLFPRSFRDADCARYISQNFTANLLGLGNAATPAGLAAAARMAQVDREGRELCRLVVLNTASLQLIPATAAALRAGAGAESAFDILPCVWLSSLVSVSAGLLASRLAEGRRA